MHMCMCAATPVAEVSVPLLHGSHPTQKPNRFSTQVLSQWAAFLPYNFKLIQWGQALYCESFDNCGKKGPLCTGLSQAYGQYTNLPLITAYANKRTQKSHA